MANFVVDKNIDVMKRKMMEHFKSRDYDYFEIDDKNVLTIHNLFTKGILVNFEPSLFLYVGMYYEEQKDYVNMVKYYLMAIEKGDSNAMNNLGWHYYYECKDYANMMKYYLMAIEKGDLNAMNNLGSYYWKQEDPANMMKYYLMAIEKGNTKAMSNLGSYYKEQQDYTNMMKYYSMAIEKGHDIAMNNLGYYYWEQQDHTNMMKYYLMAIDKGYNISVYNLGLHYGTQKDYDNMTKYYLMAIDNGCYAPLEKLIDYYTNNRLYDDLINFCVKYDHIYAKSREIINKYIRNCNKFGTYKICYNMLNEENKKYLNGFISELIVSMNANDCFDIITKFQCLDCKKHDYCVFRDCGHPVCCECFRGEIKCRLCLGNLV